MGFPGGSDSKAFACNAGHPGLILELGRSPGEGNGNPLQYSCLENSMDGGAWWATAHGVTKSWTQLNDFILRKRREILELSMSLLLRKRPMAIFLKLFNFYLN